MSKAITKLLQLQEAARRLGLLQRLEINAGFRPIDSSGTGCLYGQDQDPDPEVLASLRAGQATDVESQADTETVSSILASMRASSEKTKLAIESAKILRAEEAEMWVRWEAKKAESLRARKLTLRQSWINQGRYVRKALVD